ncbi:MAG: 50S ribosomal protein L6, partial [Thermoplasmata archaeon]|nr:50S ribosomal protein L6 [Thermoplasmata archaeon]
MSEVLGLHTDEIEVPEKVQVAIDGGHVTVKGPLGEVSRKLLDVNVEVVKQGNSVFVVINTGRAKHRALMGTFGAH